MSWAQIASGEKKMTAGERDAQTIRFLEARLAEVKEITKSLKEDYSEREEHLTKESSAAADAERRLHTLVGHLKWREERLMKDCEDAIALESFIAGGGDLSKLEEETDIEVDHWDGYDY